VTSHDAIFSELITRGGDRPGKGIRHSEKGQSCNIMDPTVGEKQGEEATESTYFEIRPLQGRLGRRGKIETSPKKLTQNGSATRVKETLN